MPNLNRIYSTLIQEERVRIMSRGKEEHGEVMSFAVQADFKSRNNRIENRDKHVVCSHCNRTGHEPENCFQLIGYPEWWGDRDRARGTGKGIAKGKGGQRGMSSFGRGRGGLVRANATQISTPGTSTNLGDINGLSGEQWQTLLNILNSTKIGATEKLTGKCFSIQWILDTGASHHMTGRLDCLSHVEDMMECPVGLPNGEQTAATKEGKVELNDELKLANVLYVPSLQCNLVSISQLIDEIDCIVYFTKKFCAIQDRSTRTVIGVGERREGLYYLQGRTTGISVATIQAGKETVFKLWHKRLGHPSFKVLELVPNIGDNKISSLHDQACDICFKAKQTRDKFPTSDNKTSESSTNSL